MKVDEKNKIIYGVNSYENNPIHKSNYDIVNPSSDHFTKNNNQQKKTLLKQGNKLTNNELNDNSHNNFNQKGLLNNLNNNFNQKGLLDNSNITPNYRNNLNNLNTKETSYANIPNKNHTDEANKLLDSISERDEYFDNYEFSEFPILNIKSRYPKLIYSFKTYFKSIRKLFKNENFDKAKFSEDILVFTDKISLDIFEKVILLYIHESMTQKNIIREMEGVLEYIDFLIIYKLKIFLISEKIDSKENQYLLNYFKNLKSSSQNFHNENFNSQENPKNNFFKNSKIENVKNFMQSIKFFFSYFQLLKKKFVLETNPDYFKNFLEIITEKRIDDLDLTETPYLVLVMQSNFLNGKLAKISGHYNKALEYFYKSREYLTICDAWIIKKSNKNIKKIYEILYQRVESDLYRIEIASSEADLNYIDKTYLNDFASNNYDLKKSSSLEFSSKNDHQLKSNSNNNHNMKLELDKSTNIFNQNNKNFENGKLLKLNKNSNYNDTSSFKVIRNHFHKQSSSNHRNNNNLNNNHINDHNSNNNNNKQDENTIRESNGHSSNSNNLKNLTIQQKIEKKKQIFHKYKCDIKEKIRLLDLEIESFRDYSKDLIIVVDISGINETEIKKYENLLKLSCGFYENYVCLGDRFGVFLGFKTITPLIPFEKKQINNYQFTKSNLNSAAKNLGNYDFINSTSHLGKSDCKLKICKSILQMFEYLNKKSNYNNEKWLILFLSNFDLDYENIRKIENESLIKKYLNLIIIGIDFDQKTIDNAKEFLKLFADKSHFFGDDNVGGLKSIFRKKVLDENKHFFPFEIYKNGKINNFNNFK